MYDQTEQAIQMIPYALLGAAAIIGAAIVVAAYILKRQPQPPLPKPLY